MRRIQLRASQLGARLFRNNVGYDRERKIKYGLCVGSADLIGWTKDGRFLAVEVKLPGGRVSKEQQAFLNAVNEAGGIGIVIRDITSLNKL